MGADPSARNNEIKNMRHDRFHAIISGANPIPSSANRMADRRTGAAGERGLDATPRAGTFARAG